MKRILTLACVAQLLLVASAFAQTAAQPLEKAQRFKLKQFPIVAWCVHDWGATDYTEGFCRTLKGAGFNIMVDTAMMVESAEKAGVPIIVNLGLDDKFTEETHKAKGVKHNVVRAVQLPGMDATKRVHAKIGKSPALAGYVMSPEAAGWLAKESPDLFPLALAGPETILVANASGFGGRNKDFERNKQQKLLGGLESGRRRANESDLVMWTWFPAIGMWKFGNSQGVSQTRFQIYASLAYGAQGLMYNDYTGWRPEWQVDKGATYIAAKKANLYVTEVLAPHVLGTRSTGVYFGDSLGDDLVPEGALRPAPGKLIEKLDAGLLAGVLVREKDFKAGKETPACVMVVDKRTSPSGGQNDLAAAREVTVTFGPQVKAAEVIGDKDEPAGKPQPGPVKLKLLPGEGRLIKVSAGG